MQEHFKNQQTPLIAAKELLAQRLMEHLRQESILIDAMHKSATKIRSFLRNQWPRSADRHEAGMSPTSPEPEPATTPAADTDSGRVSSQVDSLTRGQSFDELQQELSRNSMFIANHRRSLQNDLKQQFNHRSGVLSVHRLAEGLTDPLRQQLLDAWRDLKRTRQRLETLQLSNRLILIHSVDFYQRMLLASSESDMSQTYNSGGTANEQADSKARILRANC